MQSMGDVQLLSGARVNVVRGRELMNRIRDSTLLYRLLLVFLCLNTFINEIIKMAENTNRNAHLN